MSHEVKVGRREPITVVSRRYEVRLSQIGGVLGQAFGEVYGSLQSRGIGTAGPPFVIYHGAPQGDEPFEIEVCAPVSRAVDPPAGWGMEELPAGTFATLVHVGPYDTIGEAYEEIGAWIPANELAIAGPPREVYLSEPTVPPEQIRTIVEFPVAAATGTAPER